jgi:hypothetical protein
MLFETENIPFISIASMEVGWDMLILHVICGEETIQSREGLVVQGLKFGFETFGCEFLVNVLICFDPFRCGPRFHKHSFDVVSVIRVAYHDVPVAFAGYYQEFPGEICVESSLVDNSCIEKMRFGSQTSRCYYFIFHIRSD